LALAVRLSGSKRPADWPAHHNKLALSALHARHNRPDSSVIRVVLLARFPKYGTGRGCSIVRFRIDLLALLMVVCTGVLSATPTLAAGTSKGAASGTSSLTLVLLDSTDGLAHWGQNVTFNVSTTATTEPYVSVDCYQNGTLVYGAMAGFFASYPWPGTQTMNLSSPSWTSGGASCKATLYYYSGKKTVTLTTLNFQAYP
jgi:hypothetical protein